MFKPFKPPLLKRVVKANATEVVNLDEDELQTPPYKKRKLIHIIPQSPPAPKFTPLSSAASAPRKPLLVVKNLTDVTQKNSNTCDVAEGYYLVLWRKFTAKKHKTWDGDGVLSLQGDGYARLQDISGRELGKCIFRDPLFPGSTLSVGGKDVEVESVVSKEDFMAGRPFLNTSSKRVSSSRSVENASPTILMPTKIHKLTEKAIKPEKEGAASLGIPAIAFYAASKKTPSTAAQFKDPLLSTAFAPQGRNGSPKPRHDPNAPGALVMKRPTNCSKGQTIVDVVLDPFLGQHLRQHQRNGVKFLYECVMGMRDFNGQGALLADEMGLGKTLQTIALLWTLLKQNPIHGSDGVIKKALIVCPVTLIANWKKEFNKWLGNERIGVFVADGQKNRLTDFTHGKSYSVMIIGYEKLRSVQDELKKGTGIDIVIADEGHRLKTAQNKSAQAIRALNTPMRVVLSGTPMQNDLSEFFVMVDFVNPGILGTYNSFKKEFEGPILKSRQPEASEKDLEKGSARGEELAASTGLFILRRTAEILSQYLPPKTEYVLFCKPTQAQVQVYEHVLSSPVFGKVLGSSEASLQLITLLKKVCNAPSLLSNKDENASSNENLAQLLEVIPQELLRKSPVKSSVKFRVLDRLVKHLSMTTSEKIVIVSNYTSTLNLIGQHLTALSLPFLRLDGSTPAAKRQGLVDAFNRTSAAKSFAFLLSAKSGGAGINLIGASRLILFDVDWNPATDLQAMARIHRDGQKRPVKIYRFLMAGGMDEKIYQRQVTKTGLADSVVDGKKSESSFTAAELRDLFRLDLDATCQTHDLLGCECNGLGLLCSPPSIPELAEAKDLSQDEEDNDDDELFPVNPAAQRLVRATKENVEVEQQRACQVALERRSKHKKGKMQALMSYSHVDTSVFFGETKDVFDFELEEVKKLKGVLSDEALVQVLEDERCKVGYVFVKRG